MTDFNDIRYAPPKLFFSDITLLHDYEKIGFWREVVCLSVCPSVTTNISGTSGPIWLKFWLEIKFVNTLGLQFLEKLILKGCQPQKTGQNCQNRVKVKISRKQLHFFHENFHTNYIMGHLKNGIKVISGKIRFLVHLI